MSKKRTPREVSRAKTLADNFCGMDAEVQALTIEEIRKNLMEWCGDAKDSQWPEVRKILSPEAILFFREIVL